MEKNKVSLSNKSTDPIKGADMSHAAISKSDTQSDALREKKGAGNVNNKSDGKDKAIKNADKVCKTSKSLTKSAKDLNASKQQAPGVSGVYAQQNAGEASKDTASASAGVAAGRVESKKELKKSRSKADNKLRAEINDNLIVHKADGAESEISGLKKSSLSREEKKLLRKEKKAMRKLEEKERNSRRRFSKSKYIVSVCIAVALALTCGTFIGNYLVVTYFSNVSYDFDEGKLIDNVNLISYKGKTPDKLTASEAFVVADHILKNTDYYEMNGIGMVDTIVKQEVKSYTLKDGDYVETEYLSKSSMVNVGKRTIYTKGEKPKVYTGKPGKDWVVDWPETYSEMTLEEYKEAFGSHPGWGAVGYIVSSKTCVTQSDCTVTTDEQGNNLYSFTVTLKPVESVINYIRQMKTMSGLKNYPTFDDIQLTFTMDKDFRLLSTHTLEHYSVNYIVLAACTGTLTQTFTYTKSQV